MDKRITLKPVDTDFSLKSHLYEVLRAAITRLDIYDDATDLRLDERGLAEQLGISRTPVREALVKLEQEGFVKILPRRGVFVVRKSLSEILEMITVWAALESMAARMAAEKASDAEIGSLRALAAEYSAEGTADLEEYSEANMLFHQRILELSGCRLLLEIAKGLFVHMGAIRRRAMREGDRRRRSVVDHMGIIEAIEARDPALAADLVRVHTMRLHDHIRQSWARIEVLARRQEAAV
ncbi:MAG TPA: GntR family transcriptional regulator [Paracoccaceae bacterium]|nr:GntR family transcriptional regulator [Paracoccaceae bacterium]